MEIIHIENKKIQFFRKFCFIKILITFPAGRYCEWTHKTIDRSAEIETFEEYMTTLQLECEDGEPGYLNWTVPMDAPDLLYYQVNKILKL